MEIDQSLFPFRRSLKEISLPDLIKHNTILSMLPISKINNINDFYREVSEGLTLYLLSTVPNSQELTSKELDEYLPDVIKDKSCHIGYLDDESISQQKGKIRSSEDLALARIVKAHWPNVSSDIAFRLETIIEWFNYELTLILKDSDDKYSTLVSLTTNNPLDEYDSPISDGFKMLYQDILRCQEIPEYLPTELAQIAGQYLFPTGKVKLSQKDWNQERECALFPFRQVLSDVPLDKLTKFNRIVFAFDYLKEGSFTDFIIELAEHLAVYLLQQVPNDDTLTIGELDQYFPSVLIDILTKGHFELNVKQNNIPSENVNQLISERWPSLNETVRRYLGHIVETIEELLLDFVEYGDIKILIDLVTGQPRENYDYLSMSKAFDLIYQDVLRRQYLLDYFGPDVGKLAGRFVL